jgi:hypothetical protein
MELNIQPPSQLQVSLTDNGGRNEVLQVGGEQKVDVPVLHPYAVTRDIIIMSQVLKRYMHNFDPSTFLIDYPLLLEYFDKLKNLRDILKRNENKYYEQLHRGRKRSNSGTLVESSDAYLHMIKAVWLYYESSYNITSIVWEVIRDHSISGKSDAECFSSTGIEKLFLTMDKLKTTKIPVVEEVQVFDWN